MLSRIPLLYEEVKTIRTEAVGKPQRIQKLPEDGKQRHRLEGLLSGLYGGILPEGTRQTAYLPMGGRVN